MAVGTYPSIAKLRTILIKGSYISAEESTAAEKGAPDSQEYIERLIRRQLLSRQLLGQALAEGYGLPYSDLASRPPHKGFISLLPEQSARASRLAIVDASDKTVTIATDQPEKLTTQQLTTLFPRRKIHLTYALPEYIEGSFDLYVQPLDTRFAKIIGGSHRIAPEIVDEIVKDALQFRASDIHFEPRASDAIVRFRVDGSLRQAGTLPRAYYDNILNRIKVESGMRIDEHLSAQDGAMQHQTENETADLRVSLIPTVQGEKLVIRILGSYVQSFTFADVGMSEAHRAAVDRAIARPFGMILTVGPTGSGKTTTLYTLLQLLNKPDVNITTIEDPVEFKMAGTNQIQVRAGQDMSFARGLRAIVRQDPDIILVGEIRDRETAEIGVNAALTGHLLLSSFHANDAATAIPRLIDMDIEPFLLASTLEIVIAQRLVRRICDQCRYSLPITEAVAALKTPFDITGYFSRDDSVYAGKGCNACGGSGYRGRSAVFEIIEITPAMQELMLHTPSAKEVEQQARTDGARPMFDDGIDKIKSGLTTLSEVLRVVSAPTTTRRHVA